MDVRILGPLEVVADNGPLEFRGAKRRGLVALLAVHAGEWMSLDRIVQELWGDEGGPGAARTIQTYVSQLRRAFAGTDATITGRDGGYVLDVPVESLDAWRFEQQVRSVGELDAPVERARLLAEALAEWRGQPLDELDGEWVDRERARLELLHLQAKELHIEAQLDLGAARDVIPDLERLLETNPLDERFWGQLLVAYYRCGRQADALQAFQRARTALATELGISPGPGLVRLEQRILAQDDALLVSGDRPAVSAPLPDGTLTFLFSDIADSTRLWEEHTDDMTTTMAGHTSLVHEVVASYGGRVVKSTGDGFMIVFVDADSAVAAAVAVQQRIADAHWAVPIAVRMGLHTGTAHPEGGDYLAPPVNRAARVMAVAHPGQILVSETTAALLDHPSTRDLGEHRLPGLAPMHLHQVLAPGLRLEFPPTEASTMIRLPAPETSFVGRSDQLDVLPGLLRERRLVTLTGAGGCGKTRLAVEVARRLANDFVDGVRFVDLAAASDEGAVDDAVVDALGLTSSLGTSEPRSRIASYLADRELLVVLDNCEHLLDACAALTAEALARAGRSRILATSREPLGLVDELVFTLPSLDVGSEAVRLFADRARAVRPDAALEGREGPVVERICRRLDGIPLAIELAAAHMAVLSPTQILERLDARFLVLTGGPRRIQRQHTLAATLDWSWDLLTEDDRQVLACLAAFPARFTLEAAESVLDRDDVVERLVSLRSKSLLQVVGPTDADPQTTYRLLETVRLYAEAKLVEAGEAVTARTRHRDWVRTWLESMPLEQRWLGDDDLLANGLASIRAAIEWSVALGDLEAAAVIVCGVDWSRSEASSEGGRWCLRLLDEPDLSDELRLRLHLSEWWLGPIVGVSQGSTLVHAERALELSAGRRGPLRALAHLAISRDLVIPSIVERDEGLRRRALDGVGQAVAVSEDCAPPWRMYCRMLAGFVHLCYIQPEIAAEHFAAGIANGGDVPYTDLHAALRGYLAISCMVTGDAERAVSLAQSAFVAGALSPYWQHARAVCLVALGATGDLGTATQALRDYREVSEAIDWIYSTESVLVLAGVLATLEEDWPKAARLLSAGSTNVFRTPADYILYMTYRDRTRQALGPERSRQLRAEGRALSVDQAMALAFSS